MLARLAALALALAALAVSAQIVLPGGDTKVQCSNDSVCVDQFGPMALCDVEFCNCSQGAEFNSEEGKCVAPITSFKSDQSCQTDRDCRMEDSRCRFGKCQCETDFIQSHDQTKCLPLAKEVGWGCEEDPQCTTKLSKTTECRDFTCVCRPGTAINNLGACVESKGLDSYCASNNVCTTEHSECIQGVCACKEGFVAAADSKRCLEQAQGFKSPCEESIQCTGPFGPHSVCQRGECTCKTGNHFSDMMCWQDRGLTDRCDRPDECYIADDGNNQKLQCTAGQCICKPEFKPDLSTLRCSGAPRMAMLSGLLAVVLAAASLL
ncbi:tenascin-like [Neocloeon triangulifer]|uniref:tenascin-like n=1 Tax=Neocloeon triangulifer TaxID=2078957 RepID=UPI00286F72F2|nr:tenascin-like [Neocloeon triangulifer]